MTNAHFWRDRRVLITGCTGMLGSWMSLRLLQLGADVVGIVRDNVPHSELVRAGTIKRLNIVRGSITDSDLVLRVFSDYEIQTCIHLAAQTAVGIANRAPVPTFETNIRGSWLVLDAARQWPGLVTKHMDPTKICLTLNQWHCRGIIHMMSQNYVLI